MTILEDMALQILLVGSTHYLDIGKQTDAVVYYASPTLAYMRLPGGPILRGELAIKDDHYTTHWENGAQGKWQISYEPGKFMYVDASEQNKGGGKINKIVPGNSEQLQ